jgi:hypothetical protein
MESILFTEAAKNEQREMSPCGHDEILLLLGNAVLEHDGKEIPLREHAVSWIRNVRSSFSALEDCRYVVAGTHIVPHEH